MNKLLLTLFVLGYSLNTLLATAIAEEKDYKGKCLFIDKQENEQKFKPCKVNIQKQTLGINFDKEKYQAGDQKIRGRSITEIASGQYAKKLLSDSGGIVTGILLGPINAVGRIFVPDRDYQQYILQFKDSRGQKTATILNIDRSDAPEFQQELTVLTRKLIDFQPGQTSKVIDIGPDINR